VTLRARSNRLFASVFPARIPPDESGVLRVVANGKQSVCAPLAPIAVGLAVVAGVLRRVYPGAEWATLVLPALWNVPFLMFHDSSVGFAGPVPEWQRGMALLFGVNRRARRPVGSSCSNLFLNGQARG
jgi:hypothetical protein